jgi:GH25 family lysozyme M1 (1,4-beta-N-acetylmuramidase)
MDQTAPEQWNLVNQVEIRGAYHYQRSGKPWQAQADNFLNVIEARKYDFHFYALDLEEKRNTYSDAFFKDARLILDYWRTMAPGKKVMLYCNVSTYQNYLHPAIKKLFPADGVAWLDGVPLWLAYYYKKDPSGEGEPKTPRQRSAWDLWQYSPNGARNNYGARDLNVFRDSKEAMKAWLGI